MESFGEFIIRLERESRVRDSIKRHGTLSELQDFDRVHRIPDIVETGLATQEFFRRRNEKRTPRRFLRLD